MRHRPLRRSPQSPGATRTSDPAALHSPCAGAQAVGVMKAGQTFTIEPMVNAGSWRDATWPDGWTAATADGSRSAQFEHTLLVTDTGCDVLTKRLPTSPPLWWQT